ncbi:carboxypeptidase regulatory-like domain-containing protein [Christensenellaceae bacterium OttesenSCG-928-K19]|nr:carboxypeptidase regulatory-like domain-containing protein [Christensenellaceae bacterium OttesenSCG-928-K19]
MNKNIGRALLLVLVILLAVMPLTVFAADNGQGGNCAHTHNNTCGFTEATPCTHAHDAACGHSKGTYDVLCDMACEEGAHMEGCVYAPAVSGNPCNHTEHDGTCGYREAVPCTHQHNEACGGLPVQPPQDGESKDIQSNSNQPGESDLPKGGARILANILGEGLYSIMGNVREAWSSTMISYVTVDLYNSSNEKIASMTTNQLGTFSFNDLAPGTYTVVVAEGTYAILSSEPEERYYQGLSKETTIIDSDQDNVDMGLTRSTPAGTYMLSGYVRSMSDFFDNVSVELYDSDGNQIASAITSSGKYLFTGLENGEYTVVVPPVTYRSQYYIEGRQPATISGSNIEDVDVSMEPGSPPGTYTLSGKVQEDGTALSGVTIQLFKNGLNTMTTTSGADGSYSFTVEPGTYQIKIPKGAYGNKYCTGVTFGETTISNENETEELAFVSSPPGAPTNLTATAGDQLLAIRWTAPEGASTIITHGYEMSVTSDGTDYWQTIPFSGSNTVSVNKGSLVNGTTYTVKVRAKNEKGTSAAATTTGTPAVPPAADVTYTAEQTGGASTTADSTGIRITFNQEVSGLSLDNITITGADKKADSLVQYGAIWTIGIENITAANGENVTIDISDFNSFTVKTTPQNVVVYRAWTKESTPTAAFNGATMQLTGVTAGMKFSINGGATYSTCAGTSVDLSLYPLSTTQGIRVVQSGNGTTTSDSDPQVIPLSQAIAPNGVGKTDETATDANDGTITGVNTAMEYRLASANSWTSISGTSVNNLKPGNYEVRVAGATNTLPSDAVLLTINAYVPTYTATLTVNKDAAAWPAHGKSFTLKLITDETVTYALTGTGASLTATVPNGVWKVYEGAMYSGQNITISNANGGLTLQYYTITYSVNNANDAAGSSISARYDGQNVASGAVVMGGKTLIVTATGQGATTYTYAWSGTASGTANAYTTTVAATVNAICTVTGTNTGATVSGITVVSQPSLLSYVVGDALNLTGLSVTLTLSDGSTKTVGYAEFGAWGISIQCNGEVIAHGTALTTAQDGKPMVLTVNGHTAQTNPLAVGAVLVNHDPQNPPDPNTPIDTNKDAVFTFNGEYINLARILLNGKEMEQTNKTISSAGLTYGNYSGIAGDVRAGSVVVTLYKEFLHTLPDGVYKLDVVFNDGGVESMGNLQFTVKKGAHETPAQTAPTTTSIDKPTTKGSSPKTNDENNISFWVALCMIASISIIGTIIYRHRRTKTDY